MAECIGGHKMLGAFVKNCGGATAIEYAIIAALLSAAIIGALILFQTQMIEMFNYISENIGAALSGGS